MTTESRSSKRAPSQTGAPLAIDATGRNGSGRHTRRAILVAALLAPVLMLSSAWARDFPKEARRGQMTAFSHPMLTIGKKNYRLVPASRIRNQQNLIIMPAAAPSQAEVMYLLDFSGHIKDLWILTPDEVRTLGPAPKQ